MVINLMYTGYFRCLECGEYFIITTSSGEFEYINYAVCPRCGDDWIDYATNEQINKLDK